MKMKILKRTTVSMAALAILCCTSSCSFFSHNEFQAVKLYDIGVPPSADYSNIEVKPFTADSPARYKMLYRVANSELVTDEYNRWVLPPAQMMTKYLRTAFAVDRKPGESAQGIKYILNGNILAFEADYKEHKARLYVSYEITPYNNDDEKMKPYISSISIEVPLEKNSPDAFANAMTIASKKLTATILEDIKALAVKK